MAFGTASERLALIITGDSAGAVRAIRQVGAEADKHLNKARTTTDKWATGLTRGGAAAIGFAAVVGVGLGKAADSFENAQLSEIKLDTAMRNMPQLAGANRSEFEKLANSIQDHTKFANQDVVASEALLGQFGLTQAQILQVTPLVVDLAARMGIDLETATKAVGKSINGTSGGLVRMGIVVDKAKEKVNPLGATLDALGRSQGFAEAQGKTFSGQMAELRNHLQDVAEGVGSGVVPALESMLGPLKSTTDYFHGLDPATQKAAGSILTYGTAAVGAAGLTSVIIGQVLKARERFSELAATAPRLSGALRAVGAAGLTLGSLAVLDQIANIWRGAGPGVDRFTASLQGLAKTQVASGALTEQFGGNLKNLRGAILAVGDPSLYDKVGRVADRISTLLPGAGAAERRQRFISDVKQMDAALAGLVTGGHADQAKVAFDSIARAAESQGVKLSTVQAAFKQYETKLKDSKVAAGGAAGATDRLTGALNSDTISAHAAHEAHVKLDQALNQERDAALGLAASQLDLSDQTRGLTNDYGDYTKNAEAAARAGGKNVAANKALADSASTVQHDILGIAQTALDAANKQATLAGKTLGARQQIDVQRFALEGLKSQYPALAGFIQGYIDKLNQIPGAKDTKVTVNGRPVNVGTAGPAVVVGNTRVGSTVPFRAGGGSVGGMHPYIVGEQGPELFVPTGPGVIVPNGKFGAAANGAVIGGATNWKTLYDSVKASLRQLLDASGGPNVAGIDRLAKHFGFTLINTLASDISNTSVSPIRQAIRDRNSAILAARSAKLQLATDHLNAVETAVSAIAGAASNVTDLNAARTAHAHGGTQSDFVSAELQAIQAQQAKEEALRGLTAGGIKSFEALAARTGLSKSEIAALEQGFSRTAGSPQSGRGQVINITVHAGVGTDGRQVAKLVKDEIISLQRKGFKVA